MSCESEFSTCAWAYRIEVGGVSEFFTQGRLPKLHVAIRHAGVPKGEGGPRHCASR